MTLSSFEVRLGGWRLHLWCLPLGTAVSCSFKVSAGPAVWLSDKALGQHVGGPGFLPQPHTEVNKLELGMVADAYSPSICEAEAECS